MPYVFMANECKGNSLEIRELTLDNLNQYQELILASEGVFHPELREDLEGIVEVLSSNGAIGKVACLDGKYIGNVLGFSPTEEQIQEMELLGLKPDPKSIYVSNFVINPEFQGRGYGTQLLSKFIEEASTRGYNKLEGHFRNVISLTVAKKLGANEVEVFPDWFETGEAYTHCRLDL